MKIPGVSRIKYLAKGKRGMVYTGLYKKKKVAIKVKNPDSFARARITNEGHWLKILNKKKIGPKLVKATDAYLIYGFVDGMLFIPFLGSLEKTAKNKVLVRKIIKEILQQCFIMDRLGVDKEEMHHPTKHIFITKRLKPVMIDFERCHYTKKPKNVTQFAVYLSRLENELGPWGIRIDKDEMIKACRDYKEIFSESAFEGLLKKV